MGTCAVTIKKKTGIIPAGKAVVADITLSSSYADGGDTVTLASLGLKRCDILMLQSDAAVPAGGADVTGRSLVVINGATPFDNPKIAAYVQGAGAGPLTERAAASNESTVTVRALALALPYK